MILLDYVYSSGMNSYMNYWDSLFSCWTFLVYSEYSSILLPTSQSSLAVNIRLFPMFINEISILKKDYPLERQIRFFYDINFQFHSKKYLSNPPDPPALQLVKNTTGPHSDNKTRNIHVAPPEAFTAWNTWPSRVKRPILEAQPLRVQSCKSAGGRNARVSAERAHRFFFSPFLKRFALAAVSRTKRSARKVRMTVDLALPVHYFRRNAGASS